MKILTWFVAIVLIPLSIVASLVVVLDLTVLGTNFVKGQILKTDVYTDAAAYLPEQLLAEQQMSNQEKINATQALNEVVTPTYLQQQIEGLVDQASALIRRNSDTITVSFGDAVTKLQAAGLPISSDMIADQRFSLEQEPTVKQAIETFSTVRIGLYVAVGILLVLLLILVWQTKSFSALATLTIFLFIVELALFFVVRQLPTILKDQLVADNPIMTHFLPKIQLLAANVSGSVSLYFVGIAVISLIIAIIAIVLGKKTIKEIPAH